MGLSLTGLNFLVGAKPKKLITYYIGFDKTLRFFQLVLLVKESLNMPIFVKITTKPTFDLDKIKLLRFDEANQLVYFQTELVFKFDNVYGNLANRSRVLRQDKIQSKYIEQVISAIIDAGFCGPLVWKTKLTREGLELWQQTSDFTQIASIFAEAQQLHLFPSPAGNYYNGSNQTNLEPDIVFTL